MPFVQYRTPGKIFSEVTCSARACAFSQLAAEKVLDLLQIISQSLKTKTKTGTLVLVLTKISRRT